MKRTGYQNVTYVVEKFTCGSSFRSVQICVSITICKKSVLLIMHNSQNRLKIILEHFQLIEIFNPCRLLHFSAILNLVYALSQNP